LYNSCIAYCRAETISTQSKWEQQASRRTCAPPAPASRKRLGLYRPLLLNLPLIACNPVDAHESEIPQRIIFPSDLPDIVTKCELECTVRLPLGSSFLLAKPRRREFQQPRLQAVPFLPHAKRRFRAFLMLQPTVCPSFIPTSWLGENKVASTKGVAAFAEASVYLAILAPGSL
jgi:hypothetical protein